MFYGDEKAWRAYVKGSSIKPTTPNVPDTKPVQSGYYAEKGNYKVLKELLVKFHADFSGDSKQVIKVNQNFEIVAVVETKSGTAHGEVSGGGFVTLHKNWIKKHKKRTILSHCSGFHIGREQFLYIYNYKEIKNIVKLV